MLMNFAKADEAVLSHGRHSARRAICGGKLLLEACGPDITVIKETSHRPPYETPRRDPIIITNHRLRIRCGHLNVISIGLHGALYAVMCPMQRFAMIRHVRSGSKFRGYGIPPKGIPLVAI